ncbi:Crp/Fnr family transcriptional regulator [Streptomyces sp. NPDC059928]|uniref:Crp/Fnr family transcriptional regulator n=1 Tax=unclassified Streptomyces TaxID=2593676 RepID=UPI00365CF6A2
MYAFDEQWLGLVSQGRKHHFFEGEVLIPWAVELDEVLALTNGLVNAVIDLRSGGEQVLACRKPPWVLGDLSAVEGGITSARVVAVTRGTAVRISVREFNASLVRNGILPQAHARALRWGYDLDLMHLKDRILPLHTRVAAFLSQVAGETNPPALRECPRDVLAGFFHVDRRTLQKALKRLKETGAIALGREQVLIKDKRALHVAAAEPDEF